jgi:hypothetical protein
VAELTQRGEPRATAIADLVLRLGEHSCTTAAGACDTDPAGAIATLTAVAAAWQGLPPGDRAAALLAELAADAAFQGRLAIATKRREFDLARERLVAVDDAAATWLDRRYTAKNGATLRTLQGIAQAMQRTWPDAADTAAVLAACATHLIPVTTADFELLRRLTAVVDAVARLRTPARAKRDFRDPDFAQENRRLLPVIQAGIKALTDQAPTHAFTQAALRLAEELHVPPG